MCSIVISNCRGSQVLEVAVGVEGVQIHEHSLKQCVVLGLWGNR